MRFIRNGLLQRWLNVDKVYFFAKIGKLHSPEYIHIGNKTVFDKGIWLTAWKNGTGKPFLEIGSHCNFGAFNHITCANRIVIGDNCLTGKWVTITDNSHGETDYDSLLLLNCI